MNQETQFISIDSPISRIISLEAVFFSATIFCNLGLSFNVQIRTENQFESIFVRKTATQLEYRFGATLNLHRAHFYEMNSPDK